MIKKYITLTIVPNSSKKVKRFQISLFNIFLCLFIFLGVLVHATWVLKTFLIEETVYGAKFIKEKFEEKKSLSKKYSDKIQKLETSVSDLDDYYDRLIKISTPTKNVEEAKESKELIRQVELHKKSIFSLIASEENNLDIDLEDKNLETLKQFFRQDALEFVKPTDLPVKGFLVSAFGRDARSSISQHSPRSGILLYTEPNSLVKATQDGIVVYTGVDDILTKTVIIYHSNYIFSKYGYLSSIEVKKLQKVSKGDIIGISGDAENSSLFYQVDFLYVPQSPF